MTQVETLADYYKTIHNVIKRQLDGLTHEDTLLQLPFRGSWQGRTIK